MNLPNKLTLLRVCLVPVFMALFYMELYIPALAVFAAASITDTFDGYLARKYNLITNFGKFLDPLADKVLVIAALCCFTENGLMSSIPLIIIVSREFMVSGLRLIAAGDGVVVAAGIWGKLKTAFTMVTIIVMLLYEFISENMNASAIIDFGYIFVQVLIWISTLLTVISGAVYLKAYISYIDPSK